MERNTLNKKSILTDFAYGLVIGFLTAVIIFMTIFGLVYIGNKNREKANYVREYSELQQVIEELREDYINRDASEFLDAIPGVRTAADGARDEFERKLDEILQRFRSRLAD